MSFIRQLSFCQKSFDNTLRSIDQILKNIIEKYNGHPINLQDYIANNLHVSTHHAQLAITITQPLGMGVRYANWYYSEKSAITTEIRFFKDYLKIERQKIEIIPRVLYTDPTTRIDRFLGHYSHIIYQNSQQNLKIKFEAALQKIIHENMWQQLNNAEYHQWHVANLTSNGLP